MDTYQVTSNDEDGKAKDPKIAQAFVKLDLIKNVMYENINLTVERGEKIDGLDEKSETLEREARIFKKQSKSLKRRFCLDNAKTLAIVILLVLVVIAIIVGVIYGTLH